MYTANQRVTIQAVYMLVSRSNAKAAQVVEYQICSKAEVWTCGICEWRMDKGTIIENGEDESGDYFGKCGEIV